MNIQHRLTGRIFILLLTFLFIWGMLLRCVELLNGNYLFGFDQGRDYLAAYNIVENRKATLIGSEVGAGAAGISGLFHGPGYYYLVALVYALFRQDPYGSVVMMFVFGVATLVISYLTVRNMFGRYVGLVSLFLVGISPLIVSQSRFMWNHHPSSFFIVLVLYFAYKITKNPQLFAPIAIFTASIIYHFELAIAVPLVISIFLSLPLILRVRDIKTYLFSFATAGIGCLPFFLFEARHGWMAFRSLLSYIGGNAPFGNDISYVRLRDHVASYLNNAKNSFLIEHGFLPEWSFTALSVFLFLAIVYFAFREKDAAKKNFFRFLLMMLVVSYGMFLMLNNAIWDYYLIHAHFAYIYAFAYLLIMFWRTIRKSPWSKIGFAVFGVLLTSMIISSFNRMAINIRYDFSDLGGVEKIQGKKMAVDYIYKDAEGQPFSEFTFMPPIYTYPYDYLFLTYAKQKYGYVPGKEKKGLVYLIIETDGSKPWTYKGWLETVIVGGSVVETETLPTGHIIQKRIFSP